MPHEPAAKTEIIVEAAIGLLDTDGLSGLNMRSLGNRLNAAATSIYWHVKGKDELIGLAGARVWEEIPLPDLTVTPWREAGMSLARELLAMLTRHPWVVQSMASHLMPGRGKARFDDHSLAVYEMAGFAPTEADEAVGAVFMFVLGSALGASAMISLRRSLERSEDGNADRVIAAAMSQQVAIAQEFPRLRARAAAAESGDFYAAPGNSFEFGLQAIFDGLERRLPATGQRTTTDSDRVLGWYA